MQNNKRDSMNDNTLTSTTNDVPAGYRTNAVGYLVPESKIEAIDLLRDELVNEIIDEGKNLAKSYKNTKLKP